MFTPIETAAGALLMHISTSSLLFSTGTILGCSSILGNPTDPANLPTLTGVVLSAFATKFLLPGLVPNFPPAAAPWVTAVSGNSLHGNSPQNDESERRRKYREKTG